MPGPFVVPVHGDSELPQKVDVVVIGGGIIGVSTALELVEAGKSVAICEKGGIGHEQSSRNWGWVRVARRDPREIDLVIEAQKLWRDLNRRTGRDTGYRQTGIVFTAQNEKELADHEAWLKHLDGRGVDCRIMGKPEFDQRFSSSAMKRAGALLCMDDGRAEPQMAAPAIAERARELGAHILTECAVRGIETTNGAVSSVVTERGVIECDAVVLAGGAWSEMFLRSMRKGLHLPQLKVKNSVLRTTPMSGGPEEALWSDNFAVRKREDGGYTIASGHGNIADITPASFRYFMDFIPALKVEWKNLMLRFGWRFFDEARMDAYWKLDQPSPFEFARVLDPKPSQKLVDDSLRLAIAAFPGLKGAKIAQTWAGYIDALPDAIPVMDSVPEVPGFFVATGFSGHGFGIGPGAGKLMADLVLGRPPVVSTQAFRLKRFVDGTKIELITGY
ncbi:FAD-binding oxidoreductase [Xinfangfangia sp. CPCC 101601]|uniref:FAD-binding oxidoreductase n=1 Tax=Pseudogemmobacter lacusdianii TaxID=3069608 RepID=A0ABU0W2F3_9RHOB|nr:FAD-binding oxidoreductase [Xinfangfangia sp. CPCC 101601]MDQ2068129.1 FAD-binding oxidoreductase [Xinfangfangia sp. CPCC 101601]